MDFDGDGKPDIIGGTFEGFVYLVRGRGDGLFEEPRKLEDRNGKLIHLGEFWDYAGSRWGKEYSVGTEDLGIYPLAVDWDGDGDLDILFGGFRGVLGIRINEGSREEAVFSGKNLPVLAEKKPVKLGSGLSPAFADWDGDGRPDLLCAVKGKVYYFRNLSREGVPEFGKPEVLIERPSQYPRLAVGDFNGDGKTDLVLGAWNKKKKGMVWLYSRK